MCICWLYVCGVCELYWNFVFGCFIFFIISTSIIVLLGFVFLNWFSILVLLFEWYYFFDLLYIKTAQECSVVIVGIVFSYLICLILTYLVCVGWIYIILFFIWFEVCVYYLSSKLFIAIRENKLTWLVYFFYFPLLVFLNLFVLVSVWWMAHVSQPQQSLFCWPVSIGQKGLLNFTVSKF